MKLMVLVLYLLCFLCRREIVRDLVFNVNVGLNFFICNLLVVCVNDECEWMDIYEKVEDYVK